MFWHYRSLAPVAGRPRKQSDLLGVQARFPEVNMHLLSPELINWEMESYFELMTLAVKLGLAPKSMCVGTQLLTCEHGCVTGLGQPRAQWYKPDE